MDDRRKVTVRCADHVVERAAFDPFSWVTRDVKIVAATVRALTTEA